MYNLYIVMNENILLCSITCNTSNGIFPATMRALNQCLRIILIYSSILNMLEHLDKFFFNLMTYSGPVGSIIYADLYGSIKIKFTVLLRDTDQ